MAKVDQNNQKLVRDRTDWRTITHSHLPPTIFCVFLKKKVPSNISQRVGSRSFSLVLGAELTNAQRQYILERWVQRRKKKHKLSHKTDLVRQQQQWTTNTAGQTHNGNTVKHRAILSRM